ncbi:MAG: fatty acid desaturase [Pacificimonas sp.]
MAAGLMTTTTAPDAKAPIREEMAIARSHMGGVPWTAVIWCFANLVVWLSLWPLVLSGTLPLWLGSLIACANVALCYLPSHEAQHDIIGRPGTRWRWLNQLVGHLSTLPLVLPYRVARLTHLQHHKHVNDPALDPDHGTKATGPFDAVRQSLSGRQPGAAHGLNGYAEALKRIGRSDVILDGVVANMLFYGFLTAMAWAGFGLEALLLWWLPRHVGVTYIQFFLSWAPHHPGRGRNRYDSTRAWRSRVGNLLSMGMQYHIVHHLHPTIPLTRTPAAYREMRHILEARGCDLGGRD